MPPIVKWSQTASTVTIIIQSIPTFDNEKTVTFDNYNLILYDNVTDMKINKAGIQPIVTFQKVDNVFWNKLTESPADFIIKVDWDRWTCDEQDQDEDEDNNMISHDNPEFDFNSMGGMPGITGIIKNVYLVLSLKNAVMVL